MPEKLSEDPEVLPEDPEVFLEVPEVFIEDPEVFLEDPIVFSEDSKVLLENPKVFLEDLICAKEADRGLCRAPFRYPSKSKLNPLKTTIMSSTQDYIPANNEQYMLFQDNLNTEVTTNSTLWNIPASEVTSLNTWSSGYSPLYNAIKNKKTRTQQQVLAHDEYRKDYVKFLRGFCQGFLTNNTLIPISTRVALGLNPRGLNPPSERPKILTAPIPMLKPLGGGMVRFTFKIDSSSKRIARHPDSNGVEVYWKLTSPSTPIPPVPPYPPTDDGGQPANEADNTTGFQTFFNTRAQFTQQLGLSNVGNTLHVYAKWVNTSDSSKDGTYSAVTSMVVS